MKLMKFCNNLIYVFILSIVLVNCTSAQHRSNKLDVSKEYVLDRINKLRSKGCKCGSKYYEPAQTLVWSNTLEQTAYSHAKHMYKYDHFSHKSIDGKDVGDRFSEAGYFWQYAGENLAEGHKSFDEAMKDWIKSPTHCEMLMHPHMKELGVSRFGKYWVQHFGKKMPKNTRRKNVRYREG